MQGPGLFGEGARFLGEPTGKTDDMGTNLIMQFLSLDMPVSYSNLFE